MSALEIRHAPDAVTVYLTGDSTVTDQPSEPWNSWGQMLTRFFKPGVAIANHAESGESTKIQDGTHHNGYGSYELAKCVVEGIRQNKLALAQFIVDDLPPFDPPQPDPPERFGVPASPQRDPVKPDGN